MPRNFKDIMLPRFLQDAHLAKLQRSRKSSIDGDSRNYSYLNEQLIIEKQGERSVIDKGSLFATYRELQQIRDCLRIKLEECLEELNYLHDYVFNKVDIVMRTKELLELTNAVAKSSEIIHRDIGKFQDKYCIKLDIANDEFECLDQHFKEVNDDCSDYSLFSADTSVLQLSPLHECISPIIIKRDKSGLLSLTKKSSTYSDISRLRLPGPEVEDQLDLLNNIEDESSSAFSSLISFEKKVNKVYKRIKPIVTSSEEERSDKLKCDCKVLISQKEKLLCDTYNGDYKSVKKQSNHRKRIISSSSSNSSSCYNFNLDNATSPEDSTDIKQFAESVVQINRNETENNVGDLLTQVEMDPEITSKIGDDELLDFIEDETSSLNDDESLSSKESSEGTKNKKEENKENIDKKEKEKQDRKRKRRPLWLNDDLLAERLDETESTDEVAVKKIHLNECSSSISVSSDSSDSITFVAVAKLNSAENAVSKKGRRNIREIKSNRDLEFSTQVANREEKERVERIKEHHSQLQQWVESQNTDLFVLDANDTENMIAVDNNLRDILKDHQKRGIQFMWDNCYESVKAIEEGRGSGCILAHCMGLGKTLQVVTLVHTLFMHKTMTKTERVIVVAPLSTVLHWEEEFKSALRKAENKTNINLFLIRANELNSARVTTVKRWSRMGGVLVVGYESFICLEKKKESDHLLLNCDLIVLDEGHLLKSCKSMRTKSLTKIKTLRRIVLTGTPMQNNLKEYYSMIQFVKPNFLGTYNEFANRFINPIVNGQYDDSLERDIQLMKKRSHVLHKMTESFIQRFEETELEQYLQPKYEFVLMCQLKPLQVALYKQQLELTKTNDTLFKSYCLLRLIWSSAALLKLQAKRNVQNNTKKVKPGKSASLERVEESLLKTVNDNDWWNGQVPSDVAEKPAQYGSKFLVMQDIIEECIRVQDKLLIFSSSMAELDAIEIILVNRFQWRADKQYYRMDGSVPVATRNVYCNNFNSAYNNAKVFLLSSKVGGLGLNLVAANRVIIMDVSWNPTVDSQSVFRVYRFGQTKPCYIYRLVARGTMEEVMYERAITKQAIAGRVVDEMQIMRHFKSATMIELYRCNVDLLPNHPKMPVPCDDVLASVLQKNQFICTYQQHEELLKNIPHEELNEEQMKQAWKEYEEEKERALLANQQAPAGAIATDALVTAPENVSAVASTSSHRIEVVNPAKQFPYQVLLQLTQFDKYIAIAFSINGEPIYRDDCYFTPKQLEAAREVYCALKIFGPSKTLPRSFYIHRDGYYEHKTLIMRLNQINANINANAASAVSAKAKSIKTGIIDLAKD